MKTKITAFLTILALVFSFSLVCPMGVSYAASGGCEFSFLGFKPWHAGLDKDSANSCAIKPPADDEVLKTMVWTVILNILFDLLLAIGFLSTGFIIYGGYLYMLSSGDPGKAAKAKKTLISAIVGTAIAVLATVIVNTITTILSGAIK